MRTVPTETVLFLGDSITHAHKRPDELHDSYQLGCGYAASVAGELCSGEPGARYRFVNKGECGYVVRDVLTQWTRITPDVEATIVSVLVGVNDARSQWHRSDICQADYQQLLLAIRRRLPTAKLVLLEPFGVPVETHPTVDVISPLQLRRLSTIRSIVSDLAAATKSIFVPLQHLFTEPPGNTWTLDGIHPSAAGHWRIARAWTAAVRQAGWFPFTSQQSDNT